jgi:hypothetical protein
LLVGQEPIGVWLTRQLKRIRQMPQDGAERDGQVRVVPFKPASSIHSGAVQLLKGGMNDR